MYNSLLAATKVSAENLLPLLCADACHYDRWREVALHFSSEMVVK